MKKIFEEIEHTADIALKIYGNTLKELFQNAAKAMYFTTIEKHQQISPKKQINIKTQANDYEELLINWLSELNYTTDTKQLIFSKFQIEELKKTELSAKAYGEKYSPEKHGEILGIKAVTYHDNQNSIKKTKNKYQCTITFDI